MNEHLHVFCRWALSVYFGHHLLFMAQKSKGDFRLVSFEEEMQRAAEYDFEGEGHSQRSPGKASAFALAWIGG